MVDINCKDNSDYPLGVTESFTRAFQAYPVESPPESNGSQSTVGVQSLRLGREMPQNHCLLPPTREVLQTSSFFV